MELGVGVEGEGVLGAVGADFPPLRQVQRNGKVEGFDIDQPAKNFVDQQAGNVVLSQVGVKGGRVGEQQAEGTAVRGHPIAAVCGTCPPYVFCLAGSLLGKYGGRRFYHR